jgi:quercetin dioxygenase-like cupin family protein
VIDLRPLGAPLSDAQSTTLLRDEQLKVMRLVMPTGKELHDHAVHGPITMQCLEGEIEFTAHGHCRTMRGGVLMYLAAGTTMIGRPRPPRNA